MALDISRNLCADISITQPFTIITLTSIREHNGRERVFPLPLRVEPEPGVVRQPEVGVVGQDLVRGPRGAA